MLFNISYILAWVDSRKCEANDSYANKCQDHFVCSYGYKLFCIDERFSNRKKNDVAKNSVYKFITDMIDEVKQC